MKYVIRWEEREGIVHTVSLPTKKRMNEYLFEIRYQKILSIKRFRSEKKYHEYIKSVTPKIGISNG